MVETITLASSPALDHIIERPRLIARLAEGGGSRVSVLVAPAGYGKTTLARQWSQRQSSPVAWYRTTRASGDVALLAVQLDELLASIAPELPREPGRVASIASVNPSPQPLGRAIVRTLEPLPPETLLVVDEWEAAATAEAEELLSMLVEGLAIRFLITTRARPDWFTPRLEVYGEGLEIGMEDLAMTDDEATRVLAAVGAVAGRARLMRTAAGWPAVLGLAAMSGDVDFTSSHLLSHTLYDFLASELLAAAAEETQSSLMLLAVASVTDVEVAGVLLDTGTDRVLEDAQARGLLSVTDRKSLSLHPLLRELLIRRFCEADREIRLSLLARSRRLFEARHWDEALCVAEVAQDPVFVTDALGAALDDLLAAGRTSSLQRWVAAARAAGAEGGLIDYAESEALLRADELDKALALAGQAGRSLEGDLAARAHIVAGRSADLMDRWEAAESHAHAATALAQSQATREGALWLHYLAGVAPEAPDLSDRLEQFSRSARAGVQQSLMRAAGAVTLAQLEGDLELSIADARSALSLADEDVDPIARTGLLSTYSYTLIAMCRYRESLEHIEALKRVAETCGVEFPLAYAELFRARALTGMRRFGVASRTLSTLERQVQGQPGSYFLGSIPVERARLFASCGDLRRALEVLSPGPPEQLSKTVRGEFLGWQALLNAAAGESDRARTLSAEARVASRANEAQTLSSLADTIAAIQDAKERVSTEAVQTVVDSGFWDPIVIAIRAAPALGVFISENLAWRGWLQRLLAASCDTSLANQIGLRVPRPARRDAALTPRESEIHELIAQGLTNEEIAKLLFISLSTTKVHVKHIYNKLGVRSRLEAARALRDDV
ncbi:MAG TPA: LuxR C-terminal-related transcriptional regulator [Gaiellaceae bacterium]|nr:LuxR C-terminal-related transcriptional regulator [Gaiellaceae bacterium]